MTQFVSTPSPTLACLATFFLPPHLRFSLSFHCRCIRLLLLFFRFIALIISFLPSFSLLNLSTNSIVIVETDPLKIVRSRSLSRLFYPCWERPPTQRYNRGIYACRIACIIRFILRPVPGLPSTSIACLPQRQVRPFRSPASALIHHVPP